MPRMRYYIVYLSRESGRFKLGAMGDKKRMTDLTVRGLREETVAWLKRRAAFYNRSLEEARSILTDAVKDELTPEERAEKQREFRVLSDKLRSYTRGTRQTPSEVIIREMRDAGDRLG